MRIVIALLFSFALHSYNAHAAPSPNNAPVAPTLGQVSFDLSNLPDTQANAQPQAQPTEPATPETPLPVIKRRLDQARQVVGDRASMFVERAMTFLGVRYKMGGTSAETGFDCSGFVRAIYEQTVGLILPHRASDQAQVTQIIDKSELKPGDLVFFNTMKRAFSHVGIYVGDGKFIHAPRTGKDVRVEDMRIAYWEQRFNGARRVQVPSAEAKARP